MESRAFIKQAGALIGRCKNLQTAMMSVQEIKDVRAGMQKEINQLFQGMNNPTLPSASKMRDAALVAGFTVEGKHQARIQQAESYWE